MSIPTVQLHVTRKAILIGVAIVLLLIQAGPAARPPEDVGGPTRHTSPTAELDEWLEEPGVAVVERVTLPRLQRVRLSNGVECLSILDGSEIVDTGCTR